MLQVRNLSIAQINARLAECSNYRASHIVTGTPQDAQVVSVVNTVYGDHWDAQVLLDDKLRPFLKFGNGTLIQCHVYDFKDAKQEVAESLFEYDPLDSRWGRMYQGVSIPERNRRKSLGML